MATVRQIKFFRDRDGELCIALFAEPGLLPELWIKNIKATELNFDRLPDGIKLERKYDIEKFGIEPFDEPNSGLGFGFADTINNLGVMRRPHPQNVTYNNSWTGNTIAGNNI